MSRGKGTVRCAAAAAQSIQLGSSVSGTICQGYLSARWRRDVCVRAGVRSTEIMGAAIEVNADEKVVKLRELLKSVEVDAFIVPSEDPHMVCVLNSCVWL